MKILDVIETLLVVLSTSQGEFNITLLLKAYFLLHPRLWRDSGEPRFTSFWRTKHHFRISSSLNIFIYLFLWGGVEIKAENSTTGLRGIIWIATVSKYLIDLFGKNVFTKGYEYIGNVREETSGREIQALLSCIHKIQTEFYSLWEKINLELVHFPPFFFLPCTDVVQHEYFLVCNKLLWGSN